MPVQAETTRQAARHMEELEASLSVVRSPWQSMRKAPLDGTLVLVLLDGSDVPHAARYLDDSDKRAGEGPGWYMSWDGYKLQDHDLRYWMHSPDDPDDRAQEAA